MATVLFAQRQPLRHVSLQGLKTIIAQSTHADSLIWAHYQYGDKHLSKQLDTCIHWLKLADSLAQAHDETLKSNYIQQRMALAYAVGTQCSKSEKLLKQTRSYFKQRNDTIPLTYNYMFSGYNESVRGNYLEGKVYLTKALELAKIANDQELINDTHNRLGMLHDAIGEWDTAYMYYHKIIEDHEAGKGSFLLRAALYNSAQIKLKKGEHKRAFTLLKKSLEDRRKQPYSTSMAHGYSGLANYYSEAGQLDSAIVYMDSCLVEIRKSGHNQKLLYESRKMVLYLIEAKEYKRALDIIEYNRKTVEDYGITRTLLSKYLKTESNLYYALKDYEKGKAISDSAYHLLKQSQEAATKVNIEKAMDILSLERLEMESTKLQAKNAEQALAIEKKNTLTASLIGILSVLIGGLLMFTYVSKWRKQKNDELQAKNAIIANNLKEKEILLKEIHHRVKNNLQTISSMLNLQSRYINDPHALLAVQESRDRVKSMALIHQKMYQGEHLHGVKVADYLQALLESVRYTYKSKKNVAVHSEVDDRLILHVSSVIPIGLIINEALTNSYKYAFYERQSGNVWITLKLNSSADRKVLTLVAKDDGVGFDLESQNKGFGYVLIETLAEQLKAEYTVSGHNGFELVMDIYKFELAESPNTNN